MLPANSPIRLIHLSFSFCSPSLAKIYRKHVILFLIYFKLLIQNLEISVIALGKLTASDIYIPFPFQGLRHTHKRLEMLLEELWKETKTETI
jgi:hypothetical protein